MNKEKVFKILEKRNINPLKKFGQNFLIDDNLTQKIVNSCEVEDSDLVIEIGPGLGALTEYIVKKAKKLVCVEIDHGASEYLINEFSHHDNFSLLEQDFLTIDLDQFSEYKNIKIISNLPYYITTPIIEKIITSNLRYNSLTFMMQKEVGERILSSPGTKKYSSLSIFIQYYCNVKKVCDVSSQSYHPQPNVDSIVLQLTNKNSTYIDAKFFKFVQMCFNARRKTILNNVSNIVKSSKDEISVGFSEIGVDVRLRPEKLTFEDYQKIYNKFIINL